MSERITYENKVPLNNREEINDINKHTADDDNEIKSVVNSHADDIEANQTAISSISGGAGDAFETRALAMVSPGADNVPFVVYGETGFNGQYRYLASNPSGYVNIYLYLTPTDTVTKDSNEVVESGGVFDFRHNQYPFNETMLPFLSDGFDISQLFKQVEILYHTDETKFLPTGEIKNHFLKGFGVSGANYFIIVGREISTNVYADDTINVAISSVSSIKAIEFVRDTASLSSKYICDFTNIGTYNITTLAANNKTDIHSSLIKDESDFYTTDDLEKTGVPIDGALAKTIRNYQYPFKEGLYSFTGDFDMAKMVLDFEIYYKGNITKYTNDGRLRDNFLQGFGINGSNYFVVVARESSAGGTWTPDTINRPISEVSDTTNIVFSKWNDLYEYSITCDFTDVIAEGENVNTPNLNGRTNFNVSTIKDYSDFVHTQTLPLNSGKTSCANLNKDLKNSIDATNDIYNGSYSWWCRPHALTDGTTSILNYVDFEGNQNSYNDNDDRVTVLNTEKLYIKDEHNTPSLWKMNNGKWLSVYTGHNDDKVLRLRVGKGSISAFEDYEKNIVFPLDLTYVQVVEHSTRVFVIVREGNSKWSYIYSDDYGLNWSIPKYFMEQGSTSYAQMYVQIQMTGSNIVKIYQYFGLDDALDDNRVSYGALDLDTLLVYDKEGGSQIADISNSPILSENLKVLYSVPSDYSLRLLDTSGDSTSEAIFTISEHLISNTNTGTYKLIEYNLSNDTSVVTEIENHGGYFTHTYTGGCYIRQGLQGETDSNIILYTSRKNSSNWVIEKWQVTGGVESLLETIINDTSINVRPIPPIGALSGQGVEIFYIKASSYRGFVDWNTVIKKVDY